MTRYRNTRTGVVIDVPVEKLARMDAGWVPVEQKEPARKSTRSKQK